jgi:hypothetical protein
LDVNISSLDVLNHKRLLDSARADPSAVSFQVRPVDVVAGSDLANRPSFGSLDALHHQVRPAIAAPGGRTHPPTHPPTHTHRVLTRCRRHAQELLHLSPNKASRTLPRPAFGSSPNLQALVLEAEERLEAAGGDRSSAAAAATFYEVTIASIDQPRLLSRLSESLVRSRPGRPAN